VQAYILTFYLRDGAVMTVEANFDAELETVRTQFQRFLDGAELGSPVLAVNRREIVIVSVSPKPSDAMPSVTQ